MSMLPCRSETLKNAKNVQQNSNKIRFSYFIGVGTRRLQASFCTKFVGRQETTMIPSLREASSFCYRHGHRVVPYCRLLRRRPSSASFLRLPCMRRYRRFIWFWWCRTEELTCLLCWPCILPSPLAARCSRSERAVDGRLPRSSR